MAYTNLLLYETLRSIDSATLTGSFQAIGGPLLNQAVIVKFINNSAAFITISDDGVTNCDVIPGNSFVLYDTCSNSPPQASNGIFAPKNRQYYVSGAASTGLIYLVVQYIKQV